jgi:hypothetical protein
MKREVFVFVINGEAGIPPKRMGAKNALPFLVIK